MGGCSWSPPAPTWPGRAEPPAAMLGSLRSPLQLPAACSAASVCSPQAVPPGKLTGASDLPRARFHHGGFANCSCEQSGLRPPRPARLLTHWPSPGHFHAVSSGNGRVPAAVPANHGAGSLSFPPRDSLSKKKPSVFQPIKMKQGFAKLSAASSSTGSQHRRSGPSSLLLLVPYEACFIVHIPRNRPCLSH